MANGSASLKTGVTQGSGDGPTDLLEKSKSRNIGMKTDFGVTGLTHSDHTDHSDQSDHGDLDSDTDNVSSLLIANEGSKSYEIVNETDSEDAERTPTVLPGLDLVRHHLQSGQAVSQLGGAPEAGNHTPLITPPCLTKSLHEDTDTIVISSSDEAITKAATHTEDSACEMRNHTPLVNLSFYTKLADNASNTVVISSSVEASTAHIDACPALPRPRSRRKHLAKDCSLQPSAQEVGGALRIGRHLNATPNLSVQGKEAELSSTSKTLQQSVHSDVLQRKPDTTSDPEWKLLEGKEEGQGAASDLRIDEGIDLGSETSDEDDVVIVRVDGKEGGGVKDEMIVSVLAGEVGVLL